MKPRQQNLWVSQFGTAAVTYPTVCDTRNVFRHRLIRKMAYVLLRTNSVGVV